jgi:hypothetical protein
VTIGRAVRGVQIVRIFRLFLYDSIFSLPRFAQTRRAARAGSRGKILTNSIIGKQFRASSIILCVHK